MERYPTPVTVVPRRTHLAHHLLVRSTTAELVRHRDGWAVHYLVDGTKLHPEALITVAALDAAGLFWWLPIWGDGGESACPSKRGLDLLAMWDAEYLGGAA